MIHLANFSQAMTRQVDESLAGRLIDMYDGGRAARDAAIEAGAGQSAEALKRQVREATGDLVRAWNEVEPAASLAAGALLPVPVGPQRREILVLSGGS